MSHGPPQKLNRLKAVAPVGLEKLRPSDFRAIVTPGGAQHINAPSGGNAGGPQRDLTGHHGFGPHGKTARCGSSGGLREILCDDHGVSDLAQNIVLSERLENILAHIRVKSCRQLGRQEVIGTLHSIVRLSPGAKWLLGVCVRGLRDLRNNGLPIATQVEVPTTRVLRIRGEKLRQRAPLSGRARVGKGHALIADKFLESVDNFIIEQGRNLSHLGMVEIMVRRQREVVQRGRQFHDLYVTVVPRAFSGSQKCLGSRGIDLANSVHESKHVT